jgi:pyruvate ferredoxin oxidoreductase gamma subunit
VRAYTRYDDRPIRRHDSVEEPDAVVVIDLSLAGAPETVEGLRPDGLLLVNSDQAVPGALCVAADRIAPGAPNLVMLGALAAALGEPPLESLVAAALETLGGKADPAVLRDALEDGHAAAGRERCAA